MGKITLKDDTDIQGIIQTDNYLQQDYPSGLSGTDQDGGTIYSNWGWANLGTWTNEESPAGQLHMSAGDSSGTDSRVVGQKWGFGGSPYYPSATMQFEVYFDALAGGFVGTTATYDCFSVNFYSGYAGNDIMITSDSVWLYNSSLVWTQQFAATFNNSSWYTIRIVFYRDGWTMWSRDDGAAWVLRGNGRDVRKGTGYPGIYKLGVSNYPTSPVVTEAHVKYCVMGAGEIYPK